MKELKTGFICIDHFSGKGRKRVEEKFPSLLEDIKSIVEPVCQTDPTFHSTQLYSPIVQRQLFFPMDDNYNSPSNLQKFKDLNAPSTFSQKLYFS